MTWLQTAITCTGIVLLGVAFVGVLVRRHARMAPFFALYLGVIWLGDVLMTLWPGRFYTRDFWLLKEILTATLRFGVALELAYWTFRGFPAAAHTVRRALLFALVATYAAMVSFPTSNPTYPALVAEVLPRIANGTVWVLTAISGLVLWYRLPLRPFHKAILVGLAAYLVVFTVARGLMASYGWEALEARQQLGYLETAAFLLLEGYWCYAAWRRAEEPIQPRPTHSVSMGLQTSPGHP
jgi:hypothetical protein